MAILRSTVASRASSWLAMPLGASHWGSALDDESDCIIQPPLFKERKISSCRRERAGRLTVAIINIVTLYLSSSLSITHFPLTLFSITR